MGIPATTGACPYCRGSIPNDATACKGCGAFVATAWSQLGLWKLPLIGLFYAAGVLGGLILGIATFSLVNGLMVFAAAVAGFFVLRAHLKGKSSWIIGGRQIV